MSTEPAPKYPEVLEELAATLAASLIQSGIAREAAELAADKAAERIRLTFGGGLIYIPSGLGYRLARRNAEIRRRLAAGESRDVIRQEFQLSDMQLRRIEADCTPSRR